MHAAEAAPLREGAPAVAFEMLERPANLPHFVERNRNGKKSEQMSQKIRPLGVRIEAGIGMPVFGRTDPLARIRSHASHCGNDRQLMRMDPGQHAAAGFEGEEYASAAGFETGEFRPPKAGSQDMAVLSQTVVTDKAGGPGAAVQDHRRDRDLRARVIAPMLGVHDSREMKFGFG